VRGRGQPPTPHTASVKGPSRAAWRETAVEFAIENYETVTVCDFVATRPDESVTVNRTV
jgi:hypothetical protein